MTVAITIKIRYYNGEIKNLFFKRGDAMKNVISILLVLSIALIFLPCFAMEKEKPLSKANEMLFKAAEENDFFGIQQAINCGAWVNAEDPENNNESAWQKAIKHNAVNSLYALIDNDWRQPLYTHNKYTLSPLCYFTSQTDQEKFRMIGALTDYDITTTVLSRLGKHNSELTSELLLTKYPSNKLIFEFYNKTCETPTSAYVSFLCEAFAVSLCSFCQINEDPDPDYIKNNPLDPTLKKESLAVAQEQLNHYLDLFKIAIYLSSNTITKKITIPKTVYEFFQTNIDSYSSCDFLKNTFAAIKDIFDNQEKYNIEIKERSELVKTTIKINHMYSNSMANLIKLLDPTNKYHIQLKGSSNFESQKEDFINSMYCNEQTKTSISKAQASIAFTPILLLRSQKVKG